MQLSTRLALSLVLLAPPLAAQSIRLNGPLVEPGAGDVTDYRISPDGAHVVYRADQDHDEVFELFSAPLDGSAAPVRLHAALSGASPMDAGAFAFAAGGRVVFQGDLLQDGRDELFSAPLTGTSTPTPISGGMSPGGTVSSFLLTADGTRAVFLADAVVNGTPELLSAPVDGSAPPVALDPQGRRVNLYRLTPDGARAMFATGPAFHFQETLLAAPVDASSAPVVLTHSRTPGFVDGTFFADLLLDADNQHGAYVDSSEILDGPCGLGFENLVYGLRLGGGSTRLSVGVTDCDLPLYATVGARVLYVEPSSTFYTVLSDDTGRVQLGSGVHALRVSPDGTRVAFLSGTDANVTLFVAPVNGATASVALAGPGTLEAPRWSADSALVFFLATAPDGFRGLQAIPAAGGAPVLLNGPALAGRGAFDYAVAPQGGRIVYREDRDADEVIELFSVDATLAHENLSGPLGGFRDVLTYQISPDGERVAYLADQFHDQTNELLGAPIDGSAPALRVNPVLPSGPVQGDVTAFQPTADGQRVVYRADQDVDEFFELFSTRADGRGGPVRLTTGLLDDGDVLTSFACAPDGDRAVFQFSAGGTTTLYSAELAPDGTRVAVDTNPGAFTFPVAFAPGGRVLYRKAPPFSGPRLYTTLLDGSEPPTPVFAQSGRSVSEFQLDASGATVFYRADQSTAGMTELYRRPSDASAPAEKLNSTMIAAGDVEAFALTPDGLRVIYRADQMVDNRVDLFTRPLDLGTPAQRLNAGATAALDVSEFLVTPDSARVVFRGDQVVDTAIELYGVNADASGPAVRLTVLAAGRQVQPGFVLSPDSTTAFYRADAGPTPGTFELFRVPIDGSSVPTAANGGLVAGGSVSAFALAPDGARLVYLADQRLDNVVELFSSPAPGGPDVPLVVLPTTGDVLQFRIEPESARVLFLADALVDGRFELFRVPIDGSAAPERLSKPTFASGDVQDDFLPLPAGHVLYRADEEGNDVFELFHFLDREGRLAPFGGPLPSRGIVR